MRLHTNITTATAVLVTALAAATPAAAGSGTTGASPTVRPNPDEQVLTSQARPTDSAQSPNPAVHPNPDQQTATATTASSGPASEATSGGSHGNQSSAPVIVRVSTPKGGFDWGDAGIGAASGLGLSLLGVAGAVALSQRRARRTTGSATVTG